MKQISLLFLTVIIAFLLSSCKNSPSSEGSTAASEATSSLTIAERDDFLKKGSSITSATFVALSGKLKSALQEKGVSGAVEYCKLTAYPLVDSLSDVYQCQNSAHQLEGTKSSRPSYSWRA